MWLCCIQQTALTDSFVNDNIFFFRVLIHVFLRTKIRSISHGNIWQNGGDGKYIFSRVISTVIKGSTRFRQYDQRGWRHACTRTCMSYTHSCVPMNTWALLWMFVLPHSYTHVYKLTDIHTHTRVQTVTHIHTHVYKQWLTHTHTGPSLVIYAVEGPVGWSAWLNCSLVCRKTE